MAQAVCYLGVDFSVALAQDGLTRGWTGSSPNLVVAWTWASQSDPFQNGGSPTGGSDPSWKGMGGKDLLPSEYGAAHLAPGGET
ncbi:hypothetical protein DSO57_1003781 [Entomophthora muscae]|uniref:Uncharacterized protein n=1 Tax=Entomophthora muscae TaxID=34485 RepID=A0ACC2TK41_9FUNG|nr:hypothetical protein DSO57_1003781 [Entomophthora muscae]